MLNINVYVLVAQSWSHHFMGNRWGNSGNSVRLYFWGAPKSLWMVIAAMKLKDAYSLGKNSFPVKTNSNQVIPSGMLYRIKFCGNLEN